MITHKGKFFGLLLAIIGIVGICYALYFYKDSLPKFPVLNNQGEPTPSGFQTVDFKTIAKSGTGSYNIRINHVILNNGEFQDLLDKVGIKQEIATIDFNQEMVVAVFQGTESNSGYSIEVSKIEESSDTLQIITKEVLPGEGCVTAQIQTQPYHIVRLKRVDATKNIVFKNEQTTTVCGK